MTLDEHEALTRHMAKAFRSDLLEHLPEIDGDMDGDGVLFWSDVAARFNRGEWADAVTAIEREFEPKWHSEEHSHKEWMAMVKPITVATAAA